MQIIQKNLKNAVTKGILWDTFCVYWNLRTGTWGLGAWLLVPDGRVSMKAISIKTLMQDISKQRIYGRGIGCVWCSATYGKCTYLLYG